MVTGLGYSHRIKIIVPEQGGSSCESSTGMAPDPNFFSIYKGIFFGELTNSGFLIFQGISGNISVAGVMESF